MPAKLKVYCNEDDALLYWSIAKPIPDCRGFAIERKITRQGQTQEARAFLPNRTGFEGEKIPTPPDGKPVLKPSTEWPFQRFNWTDHDANTGDKVSYRIVPMVGKAGDLKPAEDQASDWSGPRALGEQKSERFQSFFNRGFVMSQFMARYLAENKLTPKKFKDNINDDTEAKIKRFLGGDLRKAVLDQLESAANEKREIYLAMFELSDPELVAGLVKLGKRAHLVLANGSITAKKGEGAANARKRDENADARKKLIRAKVDVALHDRFLSPGALGHNKFMVGMDKKGKPATAWTGSTNWASTGLCTQVNNGLLINDPQVAAVYFQQWKLLRAAKSAFPTTLTTSNSKPHNVGKDVTVWFTRANKKVDLAALDDAVKGAKEGVLFLMFMPGSAGLLTTVTRMSGDPKLYVRGVVSTLPNGTGDESALDVTIVNNDQHKALHLDIIQPEGVKHPFANFAAEVTRKQFLGEVGHAIIHSKVAVVDPFGANPVVITGSHNFSASASSKNDENFIIIRGDKELAEAYAVNIEAAYEHYVYRAYLEQTNNKPFNGLKDNDAWQGPKLKAAQQELEFWGL
ncbi:MAG TPA: phospholipase D-like domain-containing protein [Candidatus Bathyarchaeia archaeon]|nr:phospholipase D-like domain-containing protein [Candidatus Bathyarchaeia archaeon]